MERLPVAGYFRVSDARDGMKAPELYQNDIERYCRYRDLLTGEVFADIDFSVFRGARPPSRARAPHTGRVTPLMTG